MPIEIFRLSDPTEEREILDVVEEHGWTLRVFENATRPRWSVSIMRLQGPFGRSCGFSDASIDDAVKSLVNSLSGSIVRVFADGGEYHEFFDCTADLRKVKHYRLPKLVHTKSVEAEAVNEKAAVG